MPLGEKDKPYFPHLLPGETRVWRKFLSLHETAFDRFEYDVHLGDGTRPDEPVPTQYGNNFRFLTQKRADAFGWRGDELTIFEIRPRATPALLGSLQTYQFLYMAAHPDATPPRLQLVTELIQADDYNAMLAHGIIVSVVEP